MREVSFPHQNHLDPFKTANPLDPSPKSNSRGKAWDLHLSGSLGDSEAHQSLKAAESEAANVQIDSGGSQSLST